MKFDNRAHAGRLLAAKLNRYQRQRDVIVVALPRGGVPVAFEIARALDAPLDILVVRKLGLPDAPEVAMGAIASGGVRVLTEAIEWHDIDAATLAAVEDRERQELSRRERAYRGETPPLDPCGKIVILVDDGLATGASMKVAVLSLRKRKPRWLVAAVPIAPPDTCAELASLVDEMVCLVTPEPFGAVGNWYRDFDQTTDDEVRALLTQLENTSIGRSGGAGPGTLR